MEKSYRTIFKSAQAEFLVKRSKFIGNIEYVRNLEQAKDFALKIKNKFKDATHNVVAYSLYSGGISYCTDDGEPHGTAGKPVLEILNKGQIFDVCVVVTRYFGGILLGTGGLSLSYSSCCKEVLKKVEFARCCLCEILELILEYKFLNKIENLFILYNVKKIEEKFLEKICLKVAVEKKNCENLKKAALEATNGQIKIVSKKETWERVRI